MLQHATFSFSPCTSPLVFPKNPHIPMELGGWPLGYEEENVGLTDKLTDHVLS